MNLVVDASAILRQILSRRVPRLLVHPRLDLVITHHVAEEVKRKRVLVVAELQADRDEGSGG